MLLVEAARNDSEPKQIDCKKANQHCKLDFQIEHEISHPSKLTLIREAPQSEIASFVILFFATFSSDADSIFDATCRDAN
jgi:hypothetical protein